MTITLSPPITAFPVLSRPQAMELLGLGRHPFSALLAAGALPDLRVDTVMALASRPWVTSDELLIVVRLGHPNTDEADRTVGYSIDYTDEELLESARQWWISTPEEVVGAGHMVVVVATFAVALLHVTDVAGSFSVITPRGNTVKRQSYCAQLVARVDDLVAGNVRPVSPVPGALEPLMSVLGQRVPSPPGSPLVAVRP